MAHSLVWLGFGSRGADLLRGLAMVMLVVAGGPGRAGAVVYHCRNLDMEVTCGDGHCMRSEGFTPAELLLDVRRRAVEVCVYSGCWKGVGVVLRDGPAFVIAGGSGLRAPLSRERADVAVVIDKRRLSASVSVFGFIDPMSCERR